MSLWLILIGALIVVASVALQLRQSLRASASDGELAEGARMSPIAKPGIWLWAARARVAFPISGQNATSRPFVVTDALRLLGYTLSG